MNYRHIFNPAGHRRRRHDTIVRLLGITERDRILDIGCGHGLSLEVFNTTNQNAGGRNPQCNHVTCWVRMGTRVALPPRGRMGWARADLQDACAFRSQGNELEIGLRDRSREVRA